MLAKLLHSYVLGGSRKIAIRKTASLGKLPSVRLLQKNLMNCEFSVEGVTKKTHKSYSVNKIMELKHEVFFQDTKRNVGSMAP